MGKGHHHVTAGLGTSQLTAQDVGQEGFGKKKGVTENRLGTRQPMATWPAAHCFANRSLLEHSHLIHLHIVCGLLLCPIRAELLRQRHMTRKAENIYIYCLPFYEGTRL